MTQSNTITGNDTLVLFSRVITDFADGDTITLVFNNDRFTMMTGKNGNTVYSRNEEGNNAEMTLRIVKGSSDDQFLRSKFRNAERDFTSSILAQGSFEKRIGDGGGNTIIESYSLEGGIITRKIDSKENVSGDTEQGVSIYRIKLSRAEGNFQ